MKNTLFTFAFISVQFVQAGFEKFLQHEYWIYEGTKLGECYSELSKTFYDNYSLWIASHNFDTFYNWTSRNDLEAYLQKLPSRGDVSPEGNKGYQTARIIQWILNHKSTPYVSETIQRPWGIDVVSMHEEQPSYDFKSLKLIGEGSYGRVFEFNDGKYVIKIPRKYTTHAALQNATLKENLGCLDLRYREYVDSFIVKYFEEHEKLINGKCLFKGCVFEKIDGQTFSNYNGPSIADHCRLLAQAAMAIAMVHEAGCIVSDVKPENMMISNGVLKLIDLDSSIDLTHLSESRTIVVSPMFVAPERIIGKSIFSPAFDVYALGATILLKIKPMDETLKLAEEKLSKGLFKDEYPYESFIMQTLYGFWDEYLRKFYRTSTDIDRSSFYRKPTSEGIREAYTKLNGLGNPEASAFIGGLLQDCLAYEPKDRPSAAQVAEILLVFCSYLETLEKDPDTTCPNYDEVKGKAIAHQPKGIPMALRRMLFNPDKTLRLEARETIIRLRRTDSSYADTPSYVMAWLGPDPANGMRSFKSCSKKHPQALEQLKRRIYIYGNACEEGQDMPVPQDVYEKILATEVAVPTDSEDHP